MEEKQRLSDSSFIGIKWITVLSLLVAPVSYSINLMLGNIGPQVLGTYGLLMLFSSMIPTFLLFGGGQVLVRFLPAVHTEKRFSFIMSYTALVLSLAGIALVLVSTNPALVSSLAKSDLEVRLLPYLVLLTPILLLYHISTATLWADMEIKWMTICQKANPIVTFLGVGLLYVFLDRISQGSIPEFIARIVLASFVISLLLALYQAYTKVITCLSLNLKWSFPPGFWHFAAAVYLGTLFSFTLERFDQALVWSQLSVTELGIYRAPLTTAELVRWCPRIMAQVAFPLFANLFAQGDEARISRVYSMLTKYGVLAASTVALPVILFSRQVLSIFGDSYLGGYLSLSILASAFILTGVSAINASLLVARGQPGLIIVNGLVPSVVQIPTALFLIGPLGITGVAIGKAAAMVSYVLANSWMVSSLWNLRVHRQTLLVLAMDFGIIGLSRLITSSYVFIDIMWNVALLGGFAFAVVRVGIFGRDDLGLLVRLLFGPAHDSKMGLLSRFGA